MAKKTQVSGKLAVRIRKILDETDPEERRRLRVHAIRLVGKASVVDKLLDQMSVNTGK